MSHMTAIWEGKGLLEAYRDDFRERASNKPHVVRPSVLPLPDYYDVYVGQQAKRYLSSYDRDEPWFCWVSFGRSPRALGHPRALGVACTTPRPCPRPCSAVEAGRPLARRPSLDRWLAECSGHSQNSPAFEEIQVGAMRADYAGNVSA